MRYDAIVVGGSFAGLSAAMQLARARRRILILDAGKPRNRFARHAHGFFGRDGWQPAAMIAEARTQVLAYPTVQLVAGTTTHAERSETGFEIMLDDGQRYEAARLILATGVKDELPDLPGVQERWGITVLHCPYCHGYEVADEQLGVLDPGHRLAPQTDGGPPTLMSVHQALLVAEWGPLTYFTSSFDLDDATRGKLRARGISIESTPVTALVGDTPEQVSVALADGRVVPLGALFTGFPTAMTSPLAEQLGCAFDMGFSGPFIRTNEFKETTVPGVYAAGDATMQMHNATLASASGVSAGASTHRSLVFGN